MESSEESDSVLSDDFDGEDSEEEIGSQSTSNGVSQASSVEWPAVDEEIRHEGPPAKRAKLGKAELYKPATNEELHQLRQTENLFHSNLFRMQISELLKEVTLKEKRKKLVDAYLHKLKDLLLGLPSQAEHEVVKQEWLKKKNIEVPLMQKPFNVKGKFKFVHPSSVKVVGSYMLGTCVRPEIHVDVALQLPEGCIQGKDYLNHRYLRKRALYLCSVAMLLKGSDIVEELSFTYHHGNHFKPVLVVRPPGKLGRHVQVYLHTSAESTGFKLNRFHIQKNNVRPSWYSGTASQDEEGKFSQPATPHYNTAILHDLTLQHNLVVAHEALSDTNLKDAIALLKVWLHQRELDQGYGCFSGFILMMYVVFLLKQRKLSNMMSSYQVIRITLFNLSQSDWTQQGISLATDISDNQRPDLDDFHQAFDVVFIDPSGYVNLCAAMSKFTFLRVQQEAGLSVEALDAPGVDSFHALFMTPVPFIRKFDMVFHLSNLEKLDNLKIPNEEKLLDHGGNYIAAGLPYVLQVLNQGIGRRIKMLAVQLKPCLKWSVCEAPPHFSDGQFVTLGLLVDPVTVNSVLDKGPAADNPEAGTFRDFWGDKSELRRFQDGSIAEAVVWPGETIADKRLIVMKVVRHILKRHAAIPAEAVGFVGTKLESVLRHPHTQKMAFPYGTGEEQHTVILQAYDELCKNLRKLPDLPLKIHSIQGTSAAFRYTDVFPALPADPRYVADKVGERMVPVEGKKCPPYVPSMTVQCMLETSGKWPDDLNAVRRLKAMFHVELSSVLSSQHGLITCVYPDHIMVLKRGFVFRVQIGYFKEVTLLRMVTTPTGIVKIVENEEALALETELVTLPKLATALHGLQQQHPSYSSAVRLTKRWVASQLLADQIPEEVLELLAAQVYLKPAPFTPPGSPQAAFLRFLNLLSTHDWQTAPLIVNLNQELTKEDFADIQARFSRDRATLPLMCIATSYNKTASAWTKRKPTALILNRLVLLAHESLKVAQAQLSEMVTPKDIKQIFRPPLETYNVLIHLKPRELPRRNLGLDIPKQAAVSVPRKDSDSRGLKEQAMPVTDFDPGVLYIRELRETFDQVAMFFHDPLGGTYVAVLWKPAAFEPQAFKVSHINSSMVDAEASDIEVKLKPNVKAILEDFRIIGEGLVSKVQVLNDGSCSGTLSPMKEQ